MEDTPAITEAAPSSAAPNGADTNSQPTPGALSIDQIDTSKLSLDQLDSLLTGGNVEIPLKSGGEGNAPAPAPAQPAAPTPAGEQPPEVMAPAVVDGEGQNAQEAIDAAANAARELALSQGLDADGQQAAADAAAAEVAAQPAAAPAPKPVERPRFKEERDQLIAGVYQHAKSQSQPITWAEAEARVDGPKVEPVPVAPPVDLGRIVTDLHAELVEVTQQLDNAGDQLSNAELRNLQRKQTQLDTKITLAESNLEQATARAQELRQLAVEKSKQQRITSHDTALELYPDAGDDATPLGAAIAARVEAMQDPMHQDHQILGADSAPLTVARLVAAELGIAPVKSKTAPAKGPVTPPVIPKLVTPPPRAVMSPVPGNRTAVQPAQPAEDAKAQYDRLLKEGSLEQLDAVQGATSTAAALAAMVR